MENTFWKEFKTEYYEEYFSTHREFHGELQKFGEVKQITLLTIYNSQSNLHTDHTTGLNSGVNVRLNLPILNCEESLTCFYDIPEEYKDKYQMTPGGTKYWDSNLIKKIQPVSSFQLSEPTLIRTSFPHIVFCLKVPRIAMTISFQEDPVLDS